MRGNSRYQPREVWTGKLQCLLHKKIRQLIKNTPFMRLRSLFFVLRCREDVGFDGNPFLSIGGLERGISLTSSHQTVLDRVGASPIRLGTSSDRVWDPRGLSIGGSGASLGTGRVCDGGSNDRITNRLSERGRGNGFINMPPRSSSSPILPSKPYRQALLSSW